MTYEIHAIADDVLAAVRWGNTGVATVADGGEPLRCCLRNADAGEDLILFNYEPPLPPSPYREVGAVFAHATACDGPAPASYPEQWRGRRQILRAYDKQGWIHPSTLEHDGSAPEAVIERMLADPDVEQIHSRNVLYGCYMFAVTRTR